MRILTCTFLLLLTSTLLLGQNVGIGTSTPQAKLDIESTNSGILIPRLALTGTGDATTVPAATVSELVYNIATISDVTPGFYYWDGISSWIRVGASDDHDWHKVVGGTDMGMATAMADYIYTNGRVGVATMTPASPLHIYGGGELARIQNGGGSSGFIGFHTNLGRIGYVGDGSGGSNNMVIGADDGSGDDGTGILQVQFGLNGSRRTLTGYSNGYLGLNVANPANMLDVYETRTVSGFVARIRNSNTSTTGSGGDVLQLGIGATGSLTANNVFVEMRDGNSVVGKIEGNGTNTVAYQTTSDGRLNVPS
ncbi:MAG: hypothetical protein GY810_32015 [Aureispira sp.]|nr:hypothetical protein [Aureispira sp.]